MPWCPHCKQDRPVSRRTVTSTKDHRGSGHFGASIGAALMGGENNSPPPPPGIRSEEVLECGYCARSLAHISDSQEEYERRAKQKFAAGVGCTGLLVLLICVGWLVWGRSETPDEAPDDDKIREVENRGAAWIGSQCRNSDDCSSGLICRSFGPRTAPICTKACTSRRRLCPDRSGHPKTFCVAVGGQPWCVPRCDSSACPPGFACERNVVRYGARRPVRSACLPAPKQ